MKQIIVSLLIITLFTTQIVSQKKLTQQYSYTTNNQRTQTVTSTCSRSRQQMYQMQNSDKFKQYAGLTKNEINIEGDAAIKYLINGQPKQAWNSVKGNPQVWTYFIFMLIGLAVLVISIPFLFCCCVCPNRCPLLIRCRNRGDRNYTKVQKSGSLCLFVLLTLIIIGCMIASLALGRNFQQSYNDVQCSFAITFDDALNGNVTRDGQSFFTGLSSLRTQIIALDNAVTEIDKKIQPLKSNGTVIKQIKLKISGAKTDVKNIPDGSGGNLTLQYDSPIASSSPNTTIASIFPSVLGNFNNASTLVGKSYKGVTDIEQQVSKISNEADDFGNSISDFQKQVNNTLSSISLKIGSVSESNVQVYNYLQDIKNNQGKRAAAAFYIIVSFTLAFAIVLLVSTICMCMNRDRCKKIFYLSCGLVTIMGIFVFLLSVGASAVASTSYYSCKYLHNGMSSKQNFINYFTDIFGDETTTTIISKCITQQNGNISQYLIGNQSNKILQSLYNLTSYLNNYNETKLLQTYQQSYKQLQITIQNYLQARTLDISKQLQDYKVLQNISNANNYICSSNGFYNDSWIPSVSQVPQYINCKVINTTQVTDTTCTDISNKGNGCMGCIDTYLVFQKYNNKAEVNTTLVKRYTNADCNDFIGNLTNIWDNFYRIKKQTITPVYNRSVAAQANLQQIKTTIQTNVTPTFNDTLQSLKKSHSAIADPKYGLVAGLNCKVIGEDINLVIDTVCNNTFVYSYLLRVLLISTAFAILLAACFGTCVAVIYQQNEGGQKYDDQQQFRTDSDKMSDKIQEIATQTQSRQSGRRRRKYNSSNSNNYKPNSSQQLKSLQL